MMIVYAVLSVVLHLFVLHSQAIDLCPTSPINSDITITSGNNEIANCVVNACITIAGTATLAMSDTTISATGSVVSNFVDAYLTMSHCDIESDVEIIKGTVLISFSKIENAGRIIGTGNGYAGDGAVPETVLYLEKCDFGPSTLVPPNQIEVTYTGSAPSLGHTWSLQNSGFRGAGVIVFNTVRMAKVIIKGITFTTMTTTPGAITTAIDMGDSGMIADGSVSSMFWEISYNTGSGGVVDIAATGGIALVKMGSITPAPSTTSSSVKMWFNSNKGFAQIIQEVSTAINLLPCAADSVFEFRDNTGYFTNVPDTLVVYDFGTMEFTGCPMQIIANTFDITHTNSAASSGMVSFYTHPGQPSTTAASIGLMGNVVEISAEGAVDGAFAYFKGRASGYYSTTATVSENNVTISTTNGRAMLLYIDGQSEIQMPITVTKTIGDFTSSVQAAVMVVMPTTGLSVMGAFQVALNTFTISGGSESAALSIYSGDAATIAHADATLDYSENSAVFNYPPTTDLLDFDSGGVYLISGYLNFSSNVVSGCTSPQRVMPTIYSGTASAVGCGNRICGERVRSLHSETSGWVWEGCPLTTITKTVVVPSTTSGLTTTEGTTTTSATTLTTSTVPTATTMDLTTTVTPIYEANTTTELPQSTPTEVSTTAGSIAVAASGVFIDSASTVQLTAILLVMACQTDGGSKSAARVFLTPLRVADMPSADLVGSVLLLIGLCGIYFAVSHIVFAVLHRRGPAVGTPRIQVDEDGERTALHTPESADAEVAAKIFRAKKFLFYPRVPILVTTLLFPGIVLDSSSLLYGELSYNAAGWERFIGSVGIVAALAFIGYEHAVAAVARRHASTKDEVNRSTTDVFPTGDNDAWSEMDTSPPSLHDIPSTSMPSIKFNRTLSGNNSQAEGEEGIVMDSSIRSGSGILGQSGQTDILVTSIRKSSLTQSRNIPQGGEWMSGSLALGNFSIASLEASGAIHSNVGRKFSTPSTSVMVPSGRKEEDEPTRPLDFKDDISREASEFGSLSAPSPDVLLNSNSRLALAIGSDDGSTSAAPESMPWFIHYEATYQQDQLWIVRNTLLAAGHWSTYVERSMYCIVSSTRYQVMSWMVAHNLWRMLFFSMLGAISPADTSHCKYVQIFVAIVCFLHGLSLIVTRLFRIPALNPLQGMQSVFLGLLACAPFISDPVAQSGFSNTLMALSLVTVFFSVIAVLFEMRLQRQIDQHV